LRRALFKAHPHMQRVGQIAAGNPSDVEALAALGGNVGKDAFASAVEDFYFTNPIARASAIMAECSVIAEEGTSRVAAE
jgi:NADH-quinone oxidoreductase subunit G